SSTSARAQGCTSSRFRSAAIFREYFGEIFNQRPERSGLPSAARGVEAVRSGLPSGVRGSAAVGWFNHWAAAGVLTAIAATAATTVQAGFTVAHSVDAVKAGTGCPPEEL